MDSAATPRLAGWCMRGASFSRGLRTESDRPRGPGEVRMETARAGGASHAGIVGYAAADWRWSAGGACCFVGRRFVCDRTQNGLCSSQPIHVGVSPNATSPRLCPVRRAGVLSFTSHLVVSRPQFLNAATIGPLCVAVVAREQVPVPPRSTFTLRRRCWCLPLRAAYKRPNRITFQ